jgi:type IX secretion system PorP/SprF family membrane protein
MKKIILILFMVVNISMVNAQQNAMQNHYIYNQMYINPAYVGTKQWTTVGLNTTHQWIGLEGAPRTQILGVDGALGKTNGWGVYVLNDAIGAQSQQSIMANFSHHLKINEKWKLSMGLGAGLNNNVLDGTKLLGDVQDDQAIPRNRYNVLKFDSKTGVFAYTDRFYAGISISSLFNSSLTNRNFNSIEENPHYYFTTGYVFDLNESFKLKPSLLIKDDLKAQSNIDINTFLLYKEMIWLGLTYRFGTPSLFNDNLDKSLKRSSAIACFLEWNINRVFNIGYSYTMSTSSLMAFSGHELQLTYIFHKKEETRIISPRYF